MRTAVAVLAVAGAASAARAVVNTSIVWQVSSNGTTWSSSVDALPGQRVLVRALVSYTGTGTPAGLASFLFQPTVRGWDNDTLVPFVNNGIGGNTTTPVGVLDQPGQLFDTTSFGRVSPWGRSATSSTSALSGHVHANPDGSGATYLRISQLQVTSWFGGTGNTSGGSGVSIAQLSDVGRTTADPAFNGSLQNIYVFKFGIQISPARPPLTLDLRVESPLEGFGNLNTTTGDREVYWFANTSEVTGSIRGTATVTPARIIDIPAPGLLGCGVAGALGMATRRTRSGGRGRGVGVPGRTIQGARP